MSTERRVVPLLLTFALFFPAGPASAGSASAGSAPTGSDSESAATVSTDDDTSAALDTVDARLRLLEEHWRAGLEVTDEAKRAGRREALWRYLGQLENDLDAWPKGAPRTAALQRRWVAVRDALRAHEATVRDPGDAVGPTPVLEPVPSRVPFVTTDPRFKVVPPNDACANAATIGSGTFIGQLQDATHDSVASCDPSADRPDIWFRLVAPSPQKLYFEAIGDGGDLTVSLYQSGCPDVGFELSCGGPGAVAKTSLYPVAQVGYWVRVSGDGDFVTLQVGQGGIIEGTVVDAETGLPVPSVLVRAREQSGIDSAADTTSADGTYRLNDLESGAYHVYVDEGSAYRPQAWDGVPCSDSNCNGAGDTVQVTLEQTVGGIDFSLIRGASIRGQVTDTQGGGLSADVNLFDASGSFLGSDVADASGRYRFDGLPTGSYFVRAFENGEFLSEVYDDLSCPSPCDVTFGTPIVVQVGEVRDDVDFELLRLGSITGRVFREQDGTHINSVWIDVYDEDGDFVRAQFGTDEGVYRVTGLRPGGYRVVAESQGVELDELYDDVPCAQNYGGCDVTSGTTVEVSLETTTAGIDFELGLGARIQGTVRARVGGEPVEGADLSVSDGTFWSSRLTQSDEQGRYEIQGLPPGTWRARAGDSQFLFQVWNGVDCDFGCDPTEGSPIVLGRDEVRQGIDFSLPRLGAIEGTVRDRATGAPLAGGEVAVFRDGFLIRFEDIDADGRYQVDRLIEGTYRVAAYRLGYVAGLFGAGPCGETLNSCDPDSGATVAIAPDVTARNVDIALDREGAVRGVVRSAVSGRLLQGVRVRIYYEDGRLVDSAFTNSAGVFTFGSLLTGRYRLSARESGFLEQVYGGLDCGWYFQGCPLLDGPLVDVTLGQTTPGIDFGLSPGGTIRGRISEAGTIRGVEGRVRLLDETGSRITSTVADDNGIYVFRTLPAGTYFLETDLSGPYEDVLYDGIPCPEGSGACPLGQATPVPIQGAAQVLETDFAVPKREGDCLATDTSLCLGAGRFRASARWTTRDGATGFGRAVPLAGVDDSGYFWFFDARNVELVVKTLDACEGGFESYWVFAAGLTNVAVELTVEDTVTGDQKIYRNEQGSAFEPIQDTQAFSTCAFQASAIASSASRPADGLPTPDGLRRALEASLRARTGDQAPMAKMVPCQAGPTTLCLNGGRFQVETTWRTIDDATGSGQAVALTDDTGFFWFFDPSNLEMVVKALDGCNSAFESFWVFAGGLTNVEVTTTVTDTETGEIKTYVNPQRNPFQPIQDTRAFLTCP